MLFKDKQWLKMYFSICFRNILNNDQFNDILTSNIMVETNLYVMFKVKKGKKMVTDWCVPKEQFRSFRGKQVTLRFDPLLDEIKTKKCESCCTKENYLDFEVYVDDKSNVEKLNSAFSKNVVDWYLGKYHITGFKNYKYNGIPISDTWLNPNIIDRLVI